MPEYKGTEINTKPNDGMVSEAKRGLEWRKEYGRGGTEVGVARARDISNRSELSIDTVRRMASYFARHEVDKQGEGFSPGEKGYPSAGRIAWALWGGDSGQSWANAITKRLDSLDERSIDARPYPNEHAARVRDPNNYDEFRRINNELGDGIHIIVGYNDEGSEIQSIRFDKTKWTEKEARQWLKDNNWDVLEFEPAIEEKSMTDIQADQAIIDEAIQESVLDAVSESVVDDERKADVEVTHRAMQMEMSPINEDERRVRIAVSSEEPVMRSFGYEVLEHSQDAIDLSFLNSGRAPLLLDHDPEKQIGVVESVELDGSARRLRATVRFGKGALAREAFDDVVDGIRANISVGYAVNKMERKDKDTFVVKSWRPLEASLVAIPADTQVGVGRAAEKTEPVIKTDFKEDIPMSENTVDIAAVEAEARKAAQKNAAQIIELGARHHRSDLAQKAVSEGKSIEEFRGELLDVVGSERALESQDIGLSQKETKRFSLVRAIHALANPTDRRAQEAAQFEFECSRAASEQYGRAAQGIMLPAEVLRNWKRDLNSADEAALFTDDFRGGDFIDVLRNASSVMQAGARMLGGLSGDVKIPKKATAAAAAWIATEGGPASESEMTVGQVSMSPKTLGAFTDITRQLLIQSSLDVEALVRDDLATAIALAIDLAGLEGSGASGQPTGILNTSGVNTVTSFAAAAPTFAEVVTLETAVAEDNALMGNLAYIMPASMYGALKTTEKATGTAQFVVEPGGTINGYRGIVSNQCTAGNLYFGNFSDLLIGMFGGLDIVVDPYTNSTSGTIRVVALQSVDVAVRHAVSFAFGNDGV
jgi:HK97 family phage major capsid protein/HK97 family phage prohead protease